MHIHNAHTGAEVCTCMLTGTDAHMLIHSHTRTYTHVNMYVYLHRLMVVVRVRSVDFNSPHGNLFTRHDIPVKISNSH